ncbi:ATP-binding protein [Kaarinaea lacus]
MNQSSRILLGYLLLTALLFIVVSWAIQRQLLTDARAELGKSLNTVLHTTHSALVTWMDVHRSATLAWAGSDDVRQTTTVLLDQTIVRPIDSYKNPAERLNTWFQRINSHKNYQAFLIAAADHTILSSSNKLYDQWNTLLMQQPHFVAELFSGQAAVSAPILTEADHSTTVSQFVGAPIYDANGNPIAVLLFQFNTDKGFNQILRLAQLGTSGETYLFNQQGVLISRSRYEQQLVDIGLLMPGESSVLRISLRDPGKNLLEDKTAPPPDLPLTTMAASAITGTSDTNLTGYRDYRGVPVIGAWIWDNKYNWGIATELDVDDAFRILDESLFTISTLTLLSIILLFGLLRLYMENRRRTQAEQALRMSHERFKAQFRGVPVPTYTWQHQSLDFRLVDYNDAAEIWTHGRISNLKGKTASELYKKQRPDILADIHQCFEEKKNIHKNYWYTTLSTGLHRYLDVTYAYIPQDLVLIHINDMTERKLAEDNLQKAHNLLEERVLRRTAELEKVNAELLQEIGKRTQAEQDLRRERDKAQHCIDNVSAIIVGLDTKGNITLINQPACRILERTEDELIGNNWFDLCLPPDVKESTLSGFYKIMQGKLDGVDYYENPIISKSGRQRLIAWKNSYFTDANLKIVGALSVGEDITERRQAEELIRARQAEMAHFDRVSLMGEMATGLAHELNQPLTAINIYAGSCLQQFNDSHVDSHKLRTALERISQQAQRAANIINNLRQFLSKGVCQRKSVNINNLIRRTSDIAFADTKKLTITTHYNLFDNLPFVTIDPVQIEQVVVNLLRNALDALSKNPENERQLVIETKTLNDQEIEVSIKDNGPGIEKNNFDKLFQPFFSTKPDSMGMGLAISRSIIEAHEGRLFAVNNPQGGATFTFTLPIAQNDHD